MKVSTKDLIYVYIFMLVSILSALYLLWTLLYSGWHWAHVYWIVMIAWGYYMVWYVNELTTIAYSRKFDEAVRKWEKDGHKNEPIDL